jgi:hypothetical protein
MDSINNIYIPEINEFTAALNDIRLSGKGKSYTKDSYFKGFFDDGKKTILIRLHRYGNGSTTNKVFNKPFYKNCKTRELSVPCDYIEFLIEEQSERKVKTVRVRLTYNGERSDSLDTIDPIQKLVQYLIDHKTENVTPYFKVLIKMHARLASIYEVEDEII